MESHQTGKLLRHLRQLLEPQAAREVDDAELLRRFASLRDETAFTALMHRHGPLVWAVCRNVLMHDQDAEDAFQGTFLVLARKAGSIRKMQSVASWLHGVAYRIARKAKVAAARRRTHETRAATSPVAKPPSEMAWRELQAILDDELNRLPEKYRAPFVLCCLEGKTKKETAEDLGWKEGTVSSRLAQARKLLQQRLARRGVTLSALLCGTALAHNTATAGVPTTLAAATIKVSLAFAAGRGLGAGTPMGAVALAETMLRAMAVTRFKAAVALLLLLTLAGAGAAFALRQPAADDQAGIARPHDSPAADPSRNKGRQLRPDRAGRAATAQIPMRDGEGKMTVTGRVLDRVGRPLAGAKIAVVAGEFRQAGALGLQGRAGKKALKAGQTDAQGEFHLALPRPAVGRHYGVSLIASAKGHAPRWFTLSPREDHKGLQFDLEAGQIVRGRLIDARGVPAGQVKVHVVGMVKRGAATSVMRFSGPPNGLDSWPAPVTTDAAGQFLLRDVGPNSEVDFQVHDERFAPQWLVLKTGPKQPMQPVTFSLEPTRTLEGTVTCADTGLSMADARLLVMSRGQGASRLVSKTEGQADQQGRFRLHPFPGRELTVSAYPAEGKPYLVLQQSVKWPAGKSRHQIHFALPRGVLVRGQVVETPSGRPVSGAAVEYEPRTEDNPLARMESGAPIIDWWSQDARTGSDGRFQLAVLPGPGWLLIKGPSPDYIHVEISANQLQSGKAGGTPYFPDAVLPLDLKSNSTIREVFATLRRGVTVTGTVLGHDGRAVASAFLLAPTYLPEGSSLRSNVPPMRLPVRDGRFQLPGCDPKKSVPVLFIDSRNQQGAAVELAGKQTGGKPIVVRLAPCGSATGRCVDSTGRPLLNSPVRLDILLRPGADLQDSFAKQVDACITVSPQRLCGSPCMQRDVRTGKLIFSSLIPGATYLVGADEGNGMVRKAVIKVKAGQRLALPDIVLRSPRAGGR